MSESFDALSLWLEERREAFSHPFHVMAGMLRNVWLDVRESPPMAPGQYVDYFQKKTMEGGLPFPRVPLPEIPSDSAIEAFIGAYDLAHLIRMIRDHLYGLINHVIKVRSTCALLDYGAGAGCGLYGKEQEATLREYDLSILQHVSDPGRVLFLAIDKFMTPADAVFPASRYQKADIQTFRHPAPFDLITAHHVLEHCFHWRTVIEKVHELLRVGGFFFLSFPTFCCFMDAAYRLMTRADHTATYTHEEILAHAEALGFKTLYSAPYVDPANRWAWLTRLEPEMIDDQLQSRCYDLAVQAGARAGLFFHHYGSYVIFKKTR